MPTITPTDWLARLLQTADSSYPTGAFANSFGLEGMISLGLIQNMEQLRLFLLQDVATGLERLDLPLLRWSQAAMADGDRERLEHLDALAEACKVPTELRISSARIGRRRLALLRELSGSLDLPEEAHMPVAAGIEAAVLCFPMHAALASYAFQAMSGACACGMKLLRLGQTAVQRLLVEAGANVSAIAGRSLDCVEEDLGVANPFLDVAACRHERAFSRLFLS